MAFSTTHPLFWFIFKVGGGGIKKVYNKQQNEKMNNLFLKKWPAHHLKSQVFLNQTED